VEGTGHRIVAVDGINGKLTPELVDKAMAEYEDEHTPLPRMVYISQPTEIGSIYSKAEMTALAEKCKEKDLFLYVDGARLGSALTSESNDLTMADIASLCDMFYIGGTKNGALFGEALVIMNDHLKDDFRYLIKQRGAMLAKGFSLGIQFEELFKEDRYFKIAKHAMDMADLLQEGLIAKGYDFQYEPVTNQLFPILPNEKIQELEKDFAFSIWEKKDDSHTVVRFVTSFMTKKENVEKLLAAL
jgi:threonine aldolase